MDLMNLTPEQRKKICECKTTEDLLELVKDGTIELSDWQLERIVGGVGMTLDPTIILSPESHI